MFDIETLGVLQEVQSLIVDKLQVVSYKWLSRNFLLSSDAAKKLLQEFVDQHASDMEVVYALSGWLKNNPSSYHIRLVSRPKLEEAKQEFEGNCSVQVYSVQLCIPKDSAALWNAEFIQAEELFTQPSTVENCFRDNRFCRVSNSSVKRSVDGTPVSISVTQIQSAGILGLQSPKVVIDVKPEGTVEGADQNVKASAVREEKAHLPPKKKDGQSENKSSGSGGSLANLWGRASSKAQPPRIPADNGSSEAHVSALKDVEDGSDGETEDISFKRTSNGETNRKRRVFFDYSDEDEECVVNLASPDPPKGSSGKPSNSENKLVEDGPKMKEEKFGKCSDEEEECAVSLASPELPKENGTKPSIFLTNHVDSSSKIKEEKLTVKEVDKTLCKASSAVNTNINSENVSREKSHSKTSTDKVKDNTVGKAESSSPKRKKVVKSWIDERGREVSQVVWEGEETEKKTDTTTTSTNAESDTVTSSVSNRAPIAKKPPAVGNAAPGKAGNKKSVDKDPKQGNLFSFFKKV